MNEKVVLLVEDNDDDIELTKRSFEKQPVPLKIEVAHDGQEACDFLFGHGTSPEKQRSELPDLILLDLKMPKLDGFEVLSRIRANPLTKYIPVVILTSSSQMSDKIQAYAAGANSFVCKPVNFNEFLETTRQLATYWLMINDIPPIGAESKVF
jgi:two-component system response regulator